MIMHEPGRCPAGDISCSGFGMFTVDPFAEEIYGETEGSWMCDGVYYESMMDI